jgi:hypothetical protein
VLDVWWLNLHPDVCHPRQTWDVQLLDGILAGGVWPNGLDTPRHAETPQAPSCGAVVFINGGFHHDDVATLNERLSDLTWAVVLITSDEGSRFPLDELVPPDRHRLWVMTPRPDRHYPDGTRFVGEGWPVGTPAMLAAGDVRRSDVFFAGQVNHDRRESMWANLERYAGEAEFGIVVDGLRSDAFAHGLERDVYLERLSHSRVVLAPGGPRTPDSFRAYEALEAGCVPLLDRTTSNDYPPDGYWQLVAPGCPAPLVDDWNQLDKHLDAVLADWPLRAAECSAWWQQRKRWLALTLAADVAEVGG